MDMYETAKEIRRLTRDRKYREVVKIADRLNLGKITSGMMVLDIVEAYENQGDRKAARDALLAYYDSHGITGRNMMQKLIELCVETGDINNAVSLCLQFENSWPDSSISYLMRYQITAAAGGSYEEQIAYLEKYREVEFEERWGYELAKLYERNRERDKCARICHDLICYFGHGKYVDKAARLKEKICGLTDDEERAIAESFSKEAEEIQAREEAARNVQLADISAPAGNKQAEPAAAANDSAENSAAAANDSTENSGAVDSAPSNQENESETTLASVLEQSSDSPEKTSGVTIEARMKEAADEKLRVTEEAARKRKEEQARAEAARQAEIARQAAEKARKEEAIRKEEDRAKAARAAAGVTGEQDNAAGENPESASVKSALFDSQDDYLEPYSADEDRYSQVDQYREKEIKVTSITRPREQKKPEPAAKTRKSGGLFGSLSKVTSGIRQSFQADDGDIDTITEDDSDDNVEYITVGRESEAYEEDINERILGELDMLDEEQLAELSEDEIKEIYELKMHRNLRESIARMIRESEIADMPDESALSDFVEEDPYENDVFEEVPDAEFTETEETDSGVSSETEETDADVTSANAEPDMDAAPGNAESDTDAIPENAESDTDAAPENAEADTDAIPENAETDSYAPSETAESDSNVTLENAEAVDNIMNFIGKYVSESDVEVKKSAVHEAAVSEESDDGSDDGAVCDAEYESGEESDDSEKTGTEQPAGSSEQPAGSEASSESAESAQPSDPEQPSEPEKSAEPDIIDSIEDHDESLSINKFRECILAFAHRSGYEVEESAYLTISALAEQMQEDGSPLSVHNAEKMTNLAIARSQKKGPLDKLIGKYSRNYSTTLKDRHFYWKK